MLTKKGGFSERPKELGFYPFTYTHLLVSVCTDQAPPPPPRFFEEKGASVHRLLLVKQKIYGKAHRVGWEQTTSLR